jgi:bacteriocin-like protein
MKNQVQSELPTDGKPQAYNPTCTTMTELTDAELRAISGGINPQPLPPRANSTHML